MKDWVSYILVKRIDLVNNKDTSIVASMKDFTVSTCEEKKKKFSFDVLPYELYLN